MSVQYHARIFSRKTVWYLVSLSFLLLISLFGLVQIIPMHTELYQATIISPGTLDLPSNVFFPFHLNIWSRDQSTGVGNANLTYMGNIKVLATTSVRLQDNGSLVPAYEIELNLTNPVTDQFNQHSSSASIQYDPDGLSIQGCPTRIIHVLITTTGRVVGIPFYGLLCYQGLANNSIFPYSDFIVAGNIIIPSMTNISNYFSFLYNLSSTSYWEDWQNLVIVHGFSIWDLFHFLYFFTNDTDILTPFSFTTPYLSSNSEKQDPFAPIILSGSSINFVFAEYFNILAYDVYQWWQYTFYAFPFFQSNNSNHSTIFHLGLAQTDKMIISNIYSITNQVTTSTKVLILNFSNVTLTGNTRYIYQPNVLATYYWESGDPLGIVFWQGNKSLTVLGQSPIPNGYEEVYTFS